MKKLTKYFDVLLIAAVIVTLATFLVVQPAWAGDIHPEQIDFYESESGETLDAFMARIAPAAAAHGQARTAEVCGSIESAADGRYTMILGTTGSQLHCIVPDLWVSSPIGVIFHTHPKRRSDGKLQLTRETRSQMSAAAVTVRLGVGFSDADYDAGTGYLVDGCDLLFQSGRGTDRVVARICQ